MPRADSSAFVVEIANRLDSRKKKTTRPLSRHFFVDDLSPFLRNPLRGDIRNASPVHGPVLGWPRDSSRADQTFGRMGTTTSRTTLKVLRRCSPPMTRNDGPILRHEIRVGTTGNSGVRVKRPLHSSRSPLPQRTHNLARKFRRKRHPVRDLRADFHSSVGNWISSPSPETARLRDHCIRKPRRSGNHRPPNQ